MQTETIFLQHAITESDAAQIARALNSVKGLSKAALSTTNASINVEFEDGITSAQELQTVLERAGFPVKGAARRGEGMCCGSCGR